MEGNSSDENYDFLFSGKHNADSDVPGDNLTKSKEDDKNEQVDKGASSLKPIIDESTNELEVENAELGHFIIAEREKEASIPIPLSGQFEGSFAYRTIKDRFPVILTKVVDTLCRQRFEVVEECKLDNMDVLKDIIGRLSELRNEMQTNKAIRPLKSEAPDAVLWNNYLEYQQKLYKFEPRWFWSPWLYVECYLYRRIKEAFELSSTTFDPFRDSKRDTFINSMPAAIKLTEGLFQAISEEKEIYSDANASHLTKPKHFERFVQISLWGNKCDLSLSAGAKCCQSDNPLEQVDTLKDNIIVNDLDKLWNILSSANIKHPKCVVADVILDNACFELFCDLCFCQYLFALKLVSKVRFYVKLMPWYVSDALITDIEWLIDALQRNNNENLKQLGDIFFDNFQTKVWTIEQEMYWTLPHDYSAMENTDRALFTKLKESDLLIFKGDLNYRKLTSDRMWNCQIPFETALRGFRPTSLCALRAIKNDVVTGVTSTSKKDHLDKTEPEWLFTGDYAVIQCLP